MKKSLVIIFIGILIPFGVFSQNFKAGLSGGIVASQVDGDNLSGYNKIGLYGGIFVSYPITEIIDMTMQISYIQKGSRLNARPADGIYSSYLMRLNYAEIPLYINWKLYQEKLYMQLGFTLGYLINSVEKDEYGIISQASSVPDFRRFEFGVLGGFSYRIHEKWSAGLRGQYSVIPIRKTSLINLLYFSEAQSNNLITISLNYHF